jgi:hypothetical protein
MNSTANDSTTESKATTPSRPRTAPRSQQAAFDSSGWQILKGFMVYASGIDG